MLPEEQLVSQCEVEGLSFWLVEEHGHTEGKEQNPKVNRVVL